LQGEADTAAMLDDDRADKWGEKNFLIYFLFRNFIKCLLLLTANQ